MNNEDKCNAAIERAKKELQACGSQDCDAARQIFRLFPELSGDEDEKIRKELITHFRNTRCVTEEGAETMIKWISWLEKQKPINEEELKNGALKYVARQFMNWLDKEIPEDEMCLSNAECKAIEDAFLKEDWTSISRYMQEKLEKQYNNDSQVVLPTFTFSDILALDCCMEIVTKIQEDKDLYELLKDLHSRVRDAYHLFQKMKEAGYEWNEKNKKLRRIESKKLDFNTDFEL